MAYTDLIRQMSGPYNLNTYLLVCRETGKTVIIDPGGPAEDLAALIRKEKLAPVKVLMTHGHADPFFSMESFKQIYDIPYCIHSADDEFFKRPAVRETTRRMVGLPPPYPADRLLGHGDTISVGSSRIKVIHTPGHTPGSVCFLWENRLFTGDTLFVGEAGRVDLPGGNLETMVRSIKNRIMPLSKRTVIHPGHHHTGTPKETTLEKEIKTNIYITDFILE